MSELVRPLAGESHRFGRVVAIDEDFSDPTRSGGPRG